MGSESGAGEAPLLEAARGGDRKALEELLRLYERRVLRFGLRLCRQPEDAEDVAQETLLAAARTLPGFRGEATVATWLFGIARSFCIKKRRRSRFAPGIVSLEDEKPRVLAVADGSRRPDRVLEARRLRQALDSAISRLGPGPREVLLLRDVEGLSAPEVARITGLSVAAVKSRLHRARTEVRARLAPLLGGALARSAACPDVVRLLSRHLEGEVAPATCARMERHLDDCPACRGACHSLRRVLRLCQATPLPRVPRRVKTALAEGVRRLARAR